MNRFDPDRPSIFSKPEDDEPSGAGSGSSERAAIPFAENPTVATSVTPPSRPRPPRPPDVPERPIDPPARLSRQMIVLGSMGLAILALSGFIVTSLLRPATDRSLAAGSAAPSSTADVVVTSPSASPSGEPTVTPSPSPTPEPTPAGPPQDLAVGAWATVAVDELNVRRAAGTDETSNYVLVRGAVMHVADGPTVVGGLNWYRIASLGGAVGWVLSGWEAEPFVSTLVEDPVLIRCGEVERSVFDVVNGVPTPHDPIRIGDLALPAAAFSDLSLGAIELLRGVGGEACFSAQVGSNGVPAVSVQLAVSACGHAVADGSFFRLRPAAGQEVAVDAQVKDPAIVHPAVLVGGPPDDRKSSNLRSIVAMMASGEDATGCINLNVTEAADNTEAYQWVETTQCSIVHEYNEHNIRLSPTAAGDTAWIKLSSQAYEPGRFPLNVPVRVSVNASASDESRDAYAWPGYGPACE